MASMRRVLAVVVVPVVLLTACGPGAQPGDDTGGARRVAVLFPGLVDDGSYNQIGYEGLQRAEDEGLQIAFNEEVTQDEQLEAFRSFAQQGFDVVIGYGGEYMDSALRVAADFPDTEFVVINGDQTAENVTSVGPSFEQQGFLAGVLAGSMTRSDQVGYIVALEIPIQSLAEQGFQEGLQRVNPDAEMRKSVTGDFVDAERAREATLALIDEGVDVFWHFLDAADAGMFSAIEDRGAMAIGLNADQSELAPSVTIGSTIGDHGEVLYRAATDESVLDHEVTYLGAPDGIVDIVLSDDVPPSVVEEVEAARGELADEA